MACMEGGPRRGRSAGTGIRCRRRSPFQDFTRRREATRGSGPACGAELRRPQVNPSQKRFFSDEVQRAGSQAMRKASPGASAVLSALLPRFPVALRAGAGEAHRGQTAPRAPPDTPRRPWRTQRSAPRPLSDPGRASGLWSTRTHGSWEGRRRVPGPGAPVPARCPAASLAGPGGPSQGDPGSAGARERECARARSRAPRGGPAPSPPSPPPPSPGAAAGRAGHPAGTTRPHAPTPAQPRPPRGPFPAPLPRPGARPREEQSRRIKLKAAPHPALFAKAAGAGTPKGGPESPTPFPSLGVPRMPGGNRAFPSLALVSAS